MTTAGTGRDGASTSTTTGDGGPGAAALEAAAARLRRGAARLLAEGRAAAHRRRLERMREVSEGFRVAVSDRIAEAVRGRRAAAALLEGWLDDPRSDIAAGVERLRQAAAHRRPLKAAARDHRGPLLALFGIEAARCAERVLHGVERLEHELDELIHARLAAVDHEEKRLLLRAAGPSAWVITPHGGLEREIEAELRRFRSLTDAAIDAAARDAPR